MARLFVFILDLYWYAFGVLLPLGIYAVGWMHQS